MNALFVFLPALCFLSAPCFWPAHCHRTVRNADSNKAHSTLPTLLLGSFVTFTISLPLSLNFFIFQRVLPIYRCKQFDAFDAPPWAGFQTETPSGGANADKGLLGALISTFSVIIMGYLIGKFSWLPPPSTGMAQFMSRIALPSVVFAAMMTIDFGTLNWRLVLGLALSRTAVFAITVASSLAANRGDKLATAKAGIRGIFVTQSNDFALGLPLLASMYPTELTRYVYIAAPISFLWINPMGFALLEMGTRSSAAAAHGKKEGCGRVAWNIFKGVVSNPIVFMTFAGLVFNFIFKGAPPSVMLAPFEMLSKTFGGLALTALGMSMANKIFYLKGQARVSEIRKTLPLPTRICSKTLVLRIEGAQLNPSAASRCGSLPPSASADVRASDDVIEF